VAFFGLAGMAATTADLPSPQPLLIAAASGVAALYGVFYLMRGLYRLNCEGTQRIDRAIGREGVVYLSIPGGQNGSGKIHVTLQNRLLEFEAMTAGEPLPTGTHVVVTALQSPDRVLVVAAPETARTIHA
jgi:membrane protein implicated in regulation of membrane protease activity